MTITENFALFEFDNIPAAPARGMWVLNRKSSPAEEPESYRASENILESVQTQELIIDGTQTTLQELNIDNFDSVFKTSLRALAGENPPDGLEDAMDALLKAAKDLTEMNLDVVIGFKTIEEDDLPPIAIRASR